MTVGILDADYLMYRLGVYFEKADILNPQADYSGTVTVPPPVKTAVATAIDRIMATMVVDELQLHFTSSTKNLHFQPEFYGREAGSPFRSALGNTYKANRKSAPVVCGYHLTLRACHVLAQENSYLTTYLHDIWEADDAVVYLKKHNPDWIIGACDKDVLQASAGGHYIYDKRDKWVTTTVEHANYFNYFQAITGDTVDGYCGVPDIGPARAKKFINPSMDPEFLWAGVLKAFHSKKLTEADALLNLRFASMHQLRVNEEGLPYVNLWSPTAEHFQRYWDSNIEYA
jgi:hypothetical protein